MLKIIRIEKNPVEFKKGDLVRITAPGLPGHGKTGKILSSHGNHFQIESGPTEHKNYMHPAKRLTLAKRNPKRKKRMAVKRKKKVICASKNPFVATTTKKNAVRKARILIANAEKDLGPLSNGQRTDLIMDNMQVSHSEARAIVDYIRKPNKREIKARRKILRAKKNPPVRKLHETIIVGYSHYHDWDKPNSKRYYFNGEGFTRKRSEAKIFSGDGAKLEAKRMLQYLPQGIYAIRVETV